MTAFLIFLFTCLVLSASAAGILIFRGKARGFRLLVLAPVPAALAVGVFATAYFVAYANDYVTVLLFVIALALATWVVGFLLCALVVAVGSTLRPRTKG